MAATNASKQAKSPNAGAATQAVAHSVPGHVFGTGEVPGGEPLRYTFTTNREYMEVLASIAIAMGQTAQQGNFERMTSLLGSATRLWSIGRGGAEITGVAGESPPLTRTTAGGAN